MEKSKIDFSNITNLNYSNKSQFQQNNDDGLTNDNILIFHDDDDKMDKKEIKKNTKLEFQNILKQTKKKFKSLSEKTEQIIDSKCFSFKNFLVNKLNINSIIQKEKNINSNLINEDLNNYINDDSAGNINTYNNNLSVKLENNHFKLNQINNNISQSNLFKQNLGEINNQKLINRKRKQNNDDDDNIKIEIQIKSIFNDILNICQDISNLNNEIIKKEEKNNIYNNDENIETTLIIDDNRIATIYLTGDIINKIYIFENKKNLIKENEILSQLKILKNRMNKILNKLKKK